MRGDHAAVIEYMHEFYFESAYDSGADNRGKMLEARSKDGLMTLLKPDETCA